jgi:predicted amidohydrolase YtcJ
MLRRLAIVMAILAATALLEVYAISFWPLRNPQPPVGLMTGTIAIRNARVYRSADEPLIERGTILVRNGRIAAVGPDVPVSADATVLRRNQCSVTVGFWNTHFHLMEPRWNWSGWTAASNLNAQLAAMRTSAVRPSSTRAPTCG